ncbi:MAG: 2-phospho-L-lactate transferase [Anaerolineales bacterium]|jgi:LPPG:FO 2-phospho-L-lactate transferase|nr:2-phospho-L-lactate transferase [Chloroflexota bacterium]MBK6645364.1 2-phospho-L-lactate transferase [Anaerolineales bacterium]MCC6984857.1 2-phospho-L-lactate transferase [Anaerolineales bacterium]
MKITALAGGVGGAKLAHGLSLILPPEDLTVIVNTGDDFEHLGLNISPDLDTVCYTLAGLANPETGWGRVNESWNAFANIEKLGGPAWFRLGDRDLATHLERTRRLKEGKPLSQITKEFCEAWNINPTVLPMTDSPVRTMVETEEGELAFQEYFVHRRCEPRVKGFRFDGVDVAEPAPGAKEALQSADAVIFCPSNPWVSIDPILRVVKQINKPVVAVSPIIGGEAVKGPAAKMYRELGIEPSALAVAEHYRTILKGFVLDNADRAFIEQVESMKVKIRAADTLMKNVEDRARLAQDVLHFAGSL